MATEHEQSAPKPDPIKPDDRHVEKPDAQRVEELRAELNNSGSAKEQKVIAKELALASDHLATAHLLAQFDDRRLRIEVPDPDLASRIDRVAESFLENPIERLRDPRFKTELAYALQDAEKLDGPIHVDKNLRDELTRLAASSPGLKNEQMQKLLQKTPTIDSSELVARLREQAAEIAGKSNQTTKAIQADLNALSYEVLNAPRREPLPATTATAAIAAKQPSADPPTSTAASASSETSAQKSSLTPPSTARWKTEIDAFDSPSASRTRPSDGSAPSNDAAGSSIRENAGKTPSPDRPPIASEESQRRSPDGDASTQGKPASQERPAGESTSPRSSSIARRQTEMDAFDRSSQSTPRREPAPNRPAGSQSQQQWGEAPSKAADSGSQRPANDEQKLAASAARPASPAPTAPPPKTREPDERDSTATREIEVVQQRLVLGGVFGKAVGAIGRSASAFGRILEAATPQSGAYRQPVQQPAEQQANRDDVRQRLQAYEKTRMQPKRDDSLLHAADASGQAALDAFSAFCEAPGASILGRIQDAAKNKKGGMQAVIEGMKPGGAFEDLRKEFNVALEKNEAFRSAYDRAANALAQYGKDREGIVPALASHPNAASWNDHFKKLDAAVGEVASEIPGKKPETSMLEHLGEKAREIVEKVLEKIRGLFHRDPESRPSPSPGP